MNTHGGSINHHGDISFSYHGCDPVITSRGGRLFRYDAGDGAVSNVMVPDVTPVPGGGVFRGAESDNSLNQDGTIAFR